MTVRAKFRCVSVQKMTSARYKRDEKGGVFRDADGNTVFMEEFLYSAEFIPVGDSSPENKSFWEATPSGKLELTSILVDAFEPGRSYYLDLTEATE